MSTASATVRTASKRRVPRLLITLLLVPALAIFTLFVIVPVTQAVYYSLFDWNGFGPLTDFIGLENYTRLLGESAFIRALGNNVIFVTAAIAIQLPLALAIATLLTGRVRGRAVLRLAFFIPYIISEVVAAVLWRLMLAPAGMVNATFESLGMDWAAQLWLANPDIVMFSLVVVSTWKAFGFYTLLFLAALQAVPTERAEADAMDGASRWKIFWHITLPGIAPTVRIAGFLAIVSALQVFDLVWVMTKGGPVGSSMTIVGYMVQSGLENYQYGYASAVAVTISVIAAAAALLYQRMVLARDNEMDHQGGVK